MTMTNRHRPAPTEQPAWLDSQIDALGRAVSGLVRQRSGRLVAITVTLPSDVAAGDLKHLLTGRLALSGLDFVDITVLAQEGPVRLVSAEFET